MLKSFLWYNIFVNYSMCFCHFREYAKIINNVSYADK